MAPGSSKSKQTKTQQPNENNVPALESLSAVLKTIPKSYMQIQFSKLVAYREYRNNYIWGTIVHAYPLQIRQRKSYLRKFLLTDALNPDSSTQLTVFLLGHFAKGSEAVKEGDCLGMSDFRVENLTQQSQNPLLMSIQVYLEEAKSDTEDCSHRQIWIARKVETRPARNKQKDGKSRPPVRRSPRKVVKEVTGAVDESSTRSYVYSSLIALSSTPNGDDQYFNIYGIVDDCHLRTNPANCTEALTLSLSDSTRSGVRCTIFRKKDDGPFLDVHPGNIIRIHRLTLTTVRGELRGKCISHKFILVFEKNAKELQPKSTAKTFVYTDNDKQKVKALFLWAESKNAPKLISEITPEENASLIVQVIGVFISRKTDAVTLKVWDGTKNYNCERKHLQLREEKIDLNLFRISKLYYINLFAYGNYCLAAGQLEPGQYILVRHATMTSHPTDATVSYRLVIPSLRKEGRGVQVLKEEDPRVADLKCRLEQVRKEIETENKERESDRKNERNILLNCDISTSMPFQLNNAIDIHPPQASNHQSQIPETENPVISVVRAAVQPGQSSQEFGGIYAEIGEKRKSVEDSNENDGNENAAAKRLKIVDSNPLQLSWTCSLEIENNAQSAGLEPSQPQLAVSDSEIQPQSVAPETGSQPQLSASETDPPQIAVSETGSHSQVTAPEIISQSQSINPKTINSCQLPVIPQETNHQPPAIPQTANHQLPAPSESVNHKISNSEAANKSKQRESEQAQVLSQLYTQIESSQDNWWKSINDSVSVTDKHSQTRPSLLSEIVKHAVPHKFRVLAIALHFQPETESINQLIRLYCPFCHYLSETEALNLEVSHSNYDVHMFYCPKCRITHPDEGRLLEYSFLIVLNLHDGSGPVAFKVFLWRHHAVKFFKGITPEEALRNQDVASSIMGMLWKVCPNCRPLGTSDETNCTFYPTLDCCIMSYTAGGITRYQMFDTILI